MVALVLGYVFCEVCTEAEETVEQHVYNATSRTRWQHPERLV